MSTTSTTEQWYYTVLAVPDSVLGVYLKVPRVAFLSTVVALLRMQRMLVGTSEGIPDQGLYSKPLKFLTARLAATGLAGTRTGTTCTATRTGILYIYNSIRLCYTVILTPPESMMCQYVTTLYVMTYCVPHATMM